MMLSQEAQKQVRSIQVILVTMLGGVVAIAAIFMVLRANGSSAAPASPPTSSPLTLILFGVAGGALIAFLVLRGVFAQRLRVRAASGATDALLVTEVISPLSLTSAALAEGSALFGLIVYLVTGDLLSLIVPAIAVVLMGAAIPTVARVQRMISQPR